jgi:hypothetical protein
MVGGSRMKAPRSGVAVGGAAKRKARRIRQLEEADETIRIGKAKGGLSVCLSVCLFVCLSLFVCLFVCLSVYCLLCYV